MDFTEVIKKRRSIRQFKSKIVPEDILKRILEAGRLSPTWANKQGTRYIIVKEQEKVDEIAQATGQKWALEAPMFIIVCISPENSGKNMNKLPYFTVDAAICMEHLVLAATNEGLGTCWMGWFNEEKIRQILSIPEETRVIGITPIGYSKDYEIKPQERKPLDEIAFKEKYGNNW
ncbi:MAG: nitroreductase family protein [Promethearchaeota archaeon]